MHLNTPTYDQSLTSSFILFLSYLVLSPRVLLDFFEFDFFVVQSTYYCSSFSIPHTEKPSNKFMWFNVGWMKMVLFFWKTIKGSFFLSLYLSRSRASSHWIRISLFCQKSQELDFWTWVYSLHRRESLPNTNHLRPNPQRFFRFLDEACS